MKRDEHKRQLGRAEKIVLAVMAVAVLFTLGFFAGRSSRSGGAVTVQTQKSPEASASQTQDTGQTAESPSASETTADESPASSDALININTATAAELETLPGIGAVMAGRIIDFRETYGDFKLTDEITDVNGIGDATFENIKDLITVGDQSGGS